MQYLAFQILLTRTQMINEVPQSGAPLGGDWRRWRGEGRPVSYAITG